MHTAALLSIVASLLVHHPVTVFCHAPPDGPWQGNVWGETNSQDGIWLRHCQWTIRRRRNAEIIFGHEILHILHPNWPHSRIYPASYTYWPRVDWAIRTLGG